MNYIGDFPQDQPVYFLWATCDSAGASADRATAGTVIIYKDNGATQVSTGVTDTENFDSADLGNGLQLCTIVTTNVWFAPAHDYHVVIDQATIDGQVVSAPIAHFSIENRTGSPQAGALQITYTVYKEEAKQNVLEGCDVWVTKTNSATAPVVFRGVTDANGILVETSGSSKPWMDAGTYYFWREMSGYTFSNPDTETFS